MTHSSSTIPCASTTTVEELQKWLDQFAQERDWERFHTPKNLAMSVAIEAAELMELVQWQEYQEPSGGTQNDSPIAEEISDVLAYLLRLASVLKIDVAQSLSLKIQKNARKYPIPNATPRE